MKNKMSMMMLGACALVLALAPAATADVMILECEDYRAGSNAVGGVDSDYTVYSYYDTTVGSEWDNDYANRTADGSDVDFGFARSTDGDGAGTASQRAVCYIAAGEWFYMSGAVGTPWDTNPTFSETSYYNVTARVASSQNDKTFKIYVGGTEVVTIAVPNTGTTASSGYYTVNAVITGSQIAAGEQTVKFYTETGGFNIDWVSFEVIPEPATISLFGLAMGGTLLLRRIRM